MYLAPTAADRFVLKTNPEPKRYVSNARLTHPERCPGASSRPRPSPAKKRARSPTLPIQHANRRSVQLKRARTPTSTLRTET